MSDDFKQLVRDGYDAVAGKYASWAGRIHDPARVRWTAFLLETLPAGVPVLDLGCGNGLPSAKLLAGRFTVTGVDISRNQIEAARWNVPDADFHCAEMSALAFPAGSFAAVTAFYSIIHLPRDEQPGLFQRIAGWLQPGGYLVAVLGASDSPGDIDSDWLGAPMYWSHYPVERNEEMATDAGLEIVSSDEQTILEDDRPATFHWLVCRKADFPPE